MTDTALLHAERPSPAAALQQAFRSVLEEQMRDMPMLNPALGVEAVGFRPWSDHWLGILVTPWFMNLVLMPRVTAKWQAIRERESRHHVFPAGVFEFIGGRDAALGDYQACSLFSPMFEFADQRQAHDTAVAALAALFDVASRESPQAGVPCAGEMPAAPTQPVPMLSKRDFLLGTPPRGDRGA
jgi:[NiFe] hydrogenase assembly HybE family chaperone